MQVAGGLRSRAAPLRGPRATTARLRGFAKLRFGDEHAKLQAMVETELSADVLVDHYAGQLVAAGWQAGRAAATTRAAIADVAFSTPEGESVIGFLMVHCGLQDGFRYEVRLRIFRERER